MSRQYKFGASVPQSGVSGPNGEQSVNGLGIYVGQHGGTGNLSVVLQDGTSLLFKNVANGILPVAVRGIHGATHATPTTAQDLIVII